MVVLSNSTGYAIRALACLSGLGCEPKFVRDIAKCSGVPAPYLAKLVQRLAEAGIVNSKRGYRGGIILARKPDEISLLEIDEAVEGGAHPDRCLLGMDDCSDARACPTHAFWKKTRADIRKTLLDTTLADVLAFETKKQAATGSRSKKPSTKKPL
ncbi:MAG: Rrf2 family transcriptional regulator [Terrimicrobiaceae bacterium]